MAFTLDPRLAAEAARVAEWPLCWVGLRDERRFAWLVLVPRREALVELLDMAPADYAQLGREVLAASRLLRVVASPDKLNVGALGNVVAQLHVHVIGRTRADAAWPGNAWSVAGREPRAPVDRDLILRQLQAAAEASRVGSPAGIETGS